ncbi:hypothetical protein Leryth_023702 [Lithospermum erythrorhizon]|nr:hypothetical protein Leryth_023702 [Lithospermum erythrorhizon]
MKPVVEIVSKESIKPNTPTPQNLRNFKISFLDQLSPSSYIPTLLFYNHPLPNHANDSNILSNLKESLSEALTIYYPLAGKLKNSISIDCNDEGALFVEAQVNNYSLAMFLESPNVSSLNDFLPFPNCNCLEENSERFLVAIQITKFQCGGIVIGTCLFHRVVDTAAISCFLDTWSKIARNERDQVTYPDLFSGSKLFPPRDPIPSEFLKAFDNFFFTKSNSMKRFVFDAKAIATLKAQAASEQVPYPSRVVALTAFITKRILAARDEKCPETLMITHPVNIRQRLEPLSKNAFGNLIWLSYAFIDDESNENVELSNLAAMVREILVSVNGENLQGLDHDDMFSSYSEVIGEINTNGKVKILRFSSWCNLGFYDVDFGWGRPVWVSDMGGAIGYLSKQHFLFVDSKCGKEIELWMAYDEDGISALENDPEFIAHTIPNPGVLMHN